MMPTGVFTVWWKEIRDTVRDRRTLLSMLVMPLLLMPVIIVGIGKFTQQQITKLNAQVPNIAVSAGTGDSKISDFLRAGKDVKIVDIRSDIETALRNNEVEAVVVIPNDADADLAQEKPVHIQVKDISTRISSTTAAQKVVSTFLAYNEQLQQQRFAAQGINPAILTGIVPQPVDVASAQERGGFTLGFLIPMFIVMWAMIGGQYTAIDATAGEKERKTLEALFLAPVRRLSLVLGKFFAVGSTSFIAIIASITSMTLTVKFFGAGILASASGSADQNVLFSINAGAVAIILLISVLLVAVFSALLLTVAMFARSYREAQSYISPLYLVIILPISLMNSLPGLKVSSAMFMIPGVNGVLLFKELLLGTMNWSHIGITAASLVVAAAIAITLAVQMYKRETIVLRS